jgi:hypothetical protein
MYTKGLFLVALNTWPTLSEAGFRITPHEPDVPVSPPRVPSLPGPEIPNFIAPGRNPYEIPPKEELQNNMQLLEQKLEAVDSALDAGDEVVNAILAMVSTTITSMDATCKPNLSLSCVYFA